MEELDCCDYGDYRLRIDLWPPSVTQHADGPKFTPARSVDAPREPRL
jgi:hypothetical protein